MAFNFGEWVRKVAVNGVKAGAFGREWAALQLADYFVRGKITETDLVAFDEAMAELDDEQAKAQEEAKEQEAKA
jgi:hypothetical protein